MSHPTTDPKNCPHGHARRRKCDICDREDDHQEIERLASDSRELMAERDALTQKVCELITQRQQAQHERDCAVDKLAELREQFRQVADVMEKDGRFPTTVKAIRATVDVPSRTDKLRAALADTGVKVTVLGADDVSQNLTGEKR